MAIDNEPMSKIYVTNWREKYVDLVKFCRSLMDIHQKAGKAHTHFIWRTDCLVIHIKVINIILLFVKQTQNNYKRT